ncbi:MAG: hypothetical protein AAGF36_05290 [Pseudomonadota bacterium]
MPNLKVTVNADLGWTPATLRDLAAQLEQVLQAQLDVPARATNVLITTAITAPHTADVYAEFVFRKTPARDSAFLDGLADALAGGLPQGFVGSFAFRGFGQTAETIFARDLDLTERWVA